jgi:DNA processing protein
MRFEEKFFVLSHVACQLLGRWFSIPSVGVDCHGYASEGLDAQSWRSLLEADLSSLRPVIPWLEVLLRQRKISVDALSEAAARHCEAVQSGGGHIVAMSSDLYPRLLRHVARPPHCLSVMGNPHLLTARGVAVIGSRRASADSLKVSMEVGRAIAEKGWVVVSGGAIGCDIAAHEGALQGEQSPVGAVIVFAGGLASRFPRCNERVFRSILDRGGLLVSERLWYQDVLPRDFPTRNRIVSGMCDATIVMGAALRSGSMITAQEALEQGRDVFVFQPSDTDIRFDGSRSLIAEGAQAFKDAAEVIEMTELETGLAGCSAGTCHLGANLGTFYAEPKLN